MTANVEADFFIVYVSGIVYVVLTLTGAEEIVRDRRTCGFTSYFIGCLLGCFFYWDDFSYRGRISEPERARRKVTTHIANFTYASLSSELSSLLVLISLITVASLQIKTPEHSRIFFTLIRIFKLAAPQGFLFFLTI